MLTFIAYLKQYLYYWYYNIDISNYIGIDEVFTPFLDELALNGVFLIVCLLLLKWIHFIVEKDKTDEEILVLRISKPNGYISSIILWIALIVLLIIMVWDSFFILKDIRIGLMFLSIYTLMIIYFFIIICTNILEHNYKKYPAIVTYSFVLTFILLGNLLFTVINIGDNEKSFTRYNCRYIFNNSKEIVTSNNLIYLGRTKSKLFIYQKKVKKVSIYNTSEISYEEIMK